MKNSIRKFSPVCIAILLACFTTIPGNAQMIGNGLLGSGNGINNSGKVVGFSLDGFYHAFLWDNKKALDLTPDTFYISEAKAINDQGQIVGYSEIGFGIAK